jgi:hypothetical protein
MRHELSEQRGVGALAGGEVLSSCRDGTVAALPWDDLVTAADADAR